MAIAIAEGEKPSASAVDLRPLVDYWFNGSPICQDSLMLFI